MLLAVNFHYMAAERAADARSIFPVTVAEFGAQLDELGRNFEFISRDDLVRAVEEGVSLPERACLVTFDDGLREQSEIALPLLEERGIPAVFFVCGQPLEEPHVLFVHKVHHLREAMPDEELLPVLEEQLSREGFDVEAISPEKAKASYRYDTAEAAHVKYLLNVVLGPRRPEPVERVFAQLFSEADLAAQLYMTHDQVRELHASASLGAHAYTHRPLAVLEPADARADIERGVAVLERITGSRPRTFSYPWGSAAAVNFDVVREASTCGFAFALTMERAINRTLDEPLLLARVDANDAPGGRNPLFTVDGNDVAVVSEGMTDRRVRWLEEAA